MPLYSNDNLYVESVEDKDGRCIQLTIATPGMVKIKGSGRANMRTADCDFTAKCISVPESAHLNLYADTLTIAGCIKAPGRNVNIIARVLESLVDGGSQAEVDVSGKAGEAMFASADPWPGKAHSGAPQSPEGVPGESGSPGEEGHPGKEGNAGEPGGNIFIGCRRHIASSILTLRAVGGNGGKGQNGGPGQDGGSGGRGGDFNGDYSRGDKGCAGGNAGHGGKGGPGGASGMPGRAGTVKFCCVDGSPLDVKFVIHRGQLGEPGDGGPGGNAGLPGAGGNLIFWPKWAPIAGWEPPTKPTTISNGPTGHSERNGLQGEKGKVPSLDPEDVDHTIYYPLNALYFAHTLNAEFCQQMYNRAACLYLSISSPQEGTKLFNDALEILRFLGTYLTLAVRPFAEVKAECGNPLLLEHLESANRGFIMKPIEERERLKAIGKNCQILFNRMAMGLDFFGHPYDYVPGLSLTLYDAQYTKAYESLLKAEEYYKNIKDEISTETDIRNLNEDAKNVKLPEIASSDMQLKAIRTALGQDLETIDLLIASAKQAKETAKEAIKSFREETTKFELNFGQLLASMETLSFFPQHEGAEPFQAFMIGSQAGKLFQSFGEVETGDGRLVNRDYVLAQIDTLNDDFSNLAESYRKYQYFETDDPNGYKLLAMQNKIDYLIEPFLKKTAAKEVHKAVRDYVETVTSRNGAMLTYNAHLQQYYEKVAERDKRKLELDGIESRLATSSATAWSLIGTKNYMATQLHGIRMYCLELLYNMQRTLAYASAQPCPNIFKNSDLDKLYAPSSSAISAAYNKLNEVLLAAYQNKSLKLEPFSADKRRPTYSFAHSKYPELIDTLRRTGSVTFEISPVLPTHPADALTNAANVRVHRILVILRGAKFPHGQNDLTLTPIGAETIVDRDGNARQYPHLWEPIQVTFVLDLDETFPKSPERAGVMYDPEDDKDKYIATGVFCRWKLDVCFKEGQNRPKILSDISAIDIYLYGRTATFNSTVMSPS